MDLRWGYNQVRIRPGDEWKTAFRTRFGLFEFNVMHFGFTNAPGCFQRMLNDVLAPILDIQCTNILDDTITYNPTLEEHVKTNRLVLERFKEHHLYARAEKCEFHVKEIDFVGIHVSEKGFEMDKWKVEAIKSWPTPTKVSEMKAFLGFVNFYRKFVDHFSDIARPLYDLEKKDTPWKWEEKQNSAFQKIKDAIASEPVLGHIKQDQVFRMESNASGFAEIGRAHV